ncbi:MAG: NAD-dependent epimerase/dehydratase family protein, partial [Acidimicrobiales bacterium]
MSTSRAFITGAGGFVGACLARRLLQEGHRVDVAVRPASDHWRLEEIAADIAVHEFDLRDAAAVRHAVERAKPDWIFHCAAHGAYSWQKDARGIFETNVLGTVNLLDACKGRDLKALVHAGSSSEYGLKDHAPSEEEIPEPNSDYAVAKAATTMLCRERALRDGVHIVTLRLYSVYGPWEDPRRLLPTLVVHGLRGELPPLVARETARDFVHIDDVCDAFLLSACAPGTAGCDIYNVGSGRQTTLAE